jgi:hypothetical protein
MQIYFLCVHACPAPSHPERNAIGGAYINCWVKAATPTEAENIALAEIKNEGWVIEEIEDPPSTDFERSHESAEYLSQAQVDGECYVYHSYPISDDDKNLRRH